MKMIDPKTNPIENSKHYLFYVPLRGYPWNCVVGFVDYDNSICDTTGDSTGFTVGDVYRYSELPELDADGAKVWLKESGAF